MSKVVVEGRDFTSILYDERGRLLAADVSIAAKTSTISIAVKELLKVFPVESLRPGDMLVTNNPWWLMGHLNDVAVVAPIFSNKKLVGFAECMAHMPDIGGSISGSPRDVYEEGFIIPPLKLIEGGKENATLLAMLAANVRAPRQISGDVRALAAGCRRITGADRRVSCARKGCPTCRRWAASHPRCPRRRRDAARHRLRASRTGVYHGENDGRCVRRTAPHPRQDHLEERAGS